MIWYSLNISQDEKERFDMIKGMAEYMMSFVNPEGVRKVRDMEDSKKSSSLSPEDIMKNKDDFFEGFKDIAKVINREETNNKSKLGEDINLSSSLFDFTKDY